MVNIRNNMHSNDPKDFLILECSSNDLSDRGKKNDLNSPSLCDIKYSTTPFQMADIVEYVRPDGVVIYLKH